MDTSQRVAFKFFPTASPHQKLLQIWNFSVFVVWPSFAVAAGEIRALFVLPSTLCCWASLKIFAFAINVITRANHG
jgi:hypothetical protein